VLLYTVGWDIVAAAAADINQAIEDGALRAGEGAGLPLHRFALGDTAAAHAAVERGTVGKVLIDVGSAPEPFVAAIPEQGGSSHEHTTSPAPATSTYQGRST
jgi:hypothetical protein